MKKIILTIVLGTLLPALTFAEDRAMHNSNPNESLMSKKHMMNSSPNSSPMSKRHMMNSSPYDSKKSAKAAKTNKSDNKGWTVVKYKK